MDYKKLSDRKKRIINAVVESYIDSAEPVSSQNIRDKYLIDVSSATVRSELSSLEEMGFLIQPHTSSGRVPSVEAYKMYVGNMGKNFDLTDEELNLISSYFVKKYDKVDDIIRQIGKVLCDITNYTSVILLDKIEDITLRSVKLVDVGENRILVVIITDSGVISDKTITIENISEDYLVTASKLINRVFQGKTLKELYDIDDLINSQMEEYREVFIQILEILDNYQKTHEEQLFLDGANKIFNHKEYSSNMDETRNFLSLINKKSNLIKILEDNQDIEFSVKIGADVSEEMEHCAVVTAKLAINGKTEVHAGVIGPDRMNYNKVKAVLDYISKMLNKLDE